jgi:hypothetical protein
MEGEATDSWRPLPRNAHRLVGHGRYPSNSLNILMEKGRPF